MLGLPTLNNFFDVFFWKLTNLLNSSSFNIYIIIIIYHITIGFLKKSLQKAFFLIIVFIFFSNSFINYTTSNPLFFQKNINIALLNGVLNIHPWLIYILYTYIIYILTDFSKKSNKKNIMSRVFWKNFAKYIYFFISSSAILLGGYWAFQELSWGGWWNWDIVELISIYVFYIIISYLHKKYYHLIFLKNFNYMIILSILSSILIIKFNTIPSIHSFIISGKYKIFVYKYFILYIFIYIYLLLFIKKSNKYFNKKYYYININIIVIITIIFIHGLDQLFFKINFSDYLYILGFMFILLYIYIKLYFKKFLKYNKKKYHLNLNIFMLCIFFFKVYFSNYFIYFEIFKNSYTPLNNFLLNNNFFKKFKKLEFFENQWDMWSIHNVSVFNLNTDLYKHFYKNHIVFYKNVFIKIITPGGNNNILLAYSNMFFGLLILFYFFQKNNKKIIN
jgi:hypothetical protein